MYCGLGKTMTSDKYVIEKMDHSFGQITYPNCRASCIQNSNYNQVRGEGCDSRRWALLSDQTIVNKQQGLRLDPWLKNTVERC